MINIFIAGIVGVMSFLFFNLGISTNSINRIIINTPKEIFESSLTLVDIDTNYLYFNQEKLNKNLNDYYSKGFSKYGKNYELDIYYYDTGADYFCINGKCRYVEVDVTVYMFLTYSTTRSIHYEVRGGYIG